MSASLVGSEMCIRDSLSTDAWGLRLLADSEPRRRPLGASGGLGQRESACLLYTSDAADDM
eukprot:12423030-Alexandrium_andersonii.AAC.1